MTLFKTEFISLQHIFVCDRWKGILLSLVLFILVLFVQAQEGDCLTDYKRPNSKNKTDIGFFVGSGYQVLEHRSYDYHLILLQGSIDYRVVENNKSVLSLICIPQVNFAQFKSKKGDQLQSGNEIGLNIGILYKRYFINQKMTLYSGLGIGPHYVTEVPSIQAPGFIFSDNIYLGIGNNITQNIWMEFRLQFRHISNAGLDTPNQGINNTIFSGGFQMSI